MFHSFTYRSFLLQYWLEPVTFVKTDTTVNICLNVERDCNGGLPISRVAPLDQFAISVSRAFPTTSYNEKHWLVIAAGMLRSISKNIFNHPCSPWELT